ncbi:hypothetical protein ElyMa_005087500 [Elysia marginata]|uniref:Uncharacterized protein n=1 Tax=Elysia marginata TaxID=1093978 RepID=A0AAV4JFP0_9GAST|nr:hypothetical protein ElyMa_005087500 [Elysia marginata]
MYVHLFQDALTLKYCVDSDSSCDCSLHVEQKIALTKMFSDVIHPNHSRYYTSHHPTLPEAIFFFFFLVTLCAAYVDTDVSTDDDHEDDGNVATNVYVDGDADADATNVDDDGKKVELTSLFT